MFFPSSLTTLISPFYRWVEHQRVMDRGIQFTPLAPALDGWRVIAFVCLPLLFGWLLLFACPRSIRWIFRGFAREGQRRA
jgi:hypothetical protein